MVFKKKNDSYTMYYLLFALLFILIIVCVIAFLISAKSPNISKISRVRGSSGNFDSSDNYSGSSRIIIINSDNEPIQVTPQTFTDKPMISPDYNPEYPMRTGVIPADYQQVGILSSIDLNEEPIILPLYGRKMISRDRWEYYTASDKYNMWKLPVQYLNRDCQSDVGCEEVYNGVEVVIPEYANKVFTVKMYNYGNIRN